MEEQLWGTSILEIYKEHARLQSIMPPPPPVSRYVAYKNWIKYFFWRIREAYRYFREDI